MPGHSSLDVIHSQATQPLCDDARGALLEIGQFRVNVDIAALLYESGAHRFGLLCDLLFALFEGGIVGGTQGTGPDNEDAHRGEAKSENFLHKATDSESSFDDRLPISWWSSKEN